MASSDLDKNLDKIERDGKTSLERCKVSKKGKVFNAIHDDVVAKFWRRFAKIKNATFRGSTLDVVNDHARGLTLLNEAHKTVFDLHNLHEQNYSAKQWAKNKKERLEWIVGMKNALDSLTKKLELRVERGDPSRSHPNREEVPELPAIMEAPLLLLEEKLNRKHYKREKQNDAPRSTDILFQVAPHLKDLHNLIWTLQQKRVDVCVMLLTFADWIGSALQNAQESDEWPKLSNNVGQILFTAFEAANCSSWALLRRLYAVDLCENFILLSQSSSHKLKRVTSSILTQQMGEKKAEEQNKNPTEQKITEENAVAMENTVEENKKKEEEEKKKTEEEKEREERRKVVEDSSQEQLAKVCPWKKHLDLKTNQYFYYHTTSGQSQWIKPKDYFDPPTKTTQSKAPSFVSSMKPDYSPTVQPRTIAINNIKKKQSKINHQGGGDWRIG